jgi:hypothetical protein
MGNEAISYDDVISRLQQRVAGFKPEDPELPHVAFGQLVAYLADQLETDSGEGEVRRIIGFIEDAASSSDEQVVELVVVSFIENLHNLGPRCQTVRAMFGPQTSKLARDYEHKGGGKVCP